MKAYSEHNIRKFKKENCSTCKVPCEGLIDSESRCSACEASIKDVSLFCVTSFETNTELLCGKCVVYEGYKITENGELRLIKKEDLENSDENTKL